VDLLAPAFDREDAEEVFQTLVDWGRIESAVEPERPFVDAPAAFYRFVEYSEDRLMLGESAHLFPLRSCELALLRAQQQVSCPHCKRDLRIDQLAPDLTLRGLPVPAFSLGAVLNRTPVGEGGYATVYRGVFEGAQVACKVLHQRCANDDADEAEANCAIATDFRRETWTMSKLSHPNVVRLLGVCRQPLAFLMELMPDGDLRSYLNRVRELTWEFRLQVALGIAYGLLHMHAGQLPLCHLDLKSPNVLLCVHEDGRVTAKLADFGVSRPLGLTTRLARWDQRDNCIWQAPEMLRQDAFDASSDIYSLGIILWELLTAELPFAECSWMSEIEERVLAGDRPALPAQLGDAVPSFVSLMHRCWSGEPQKRPPASLCARALERTQEEYAALDPKPPPTLVRRDHLPLVVPVQSLVPVSKHEASMTNALPKRLHVLRSGRAPTPPPLPGLDDSADAPPLPDMSESLDSSPPPLPPSPFSSSPDLAPLPAPSTDPPTA
jgi:serine/threonine protein kinase